MTQQTEEPAFEVFEDSDTPTSVHKMQGFLRETMSQSTL